MDETLKYVKEQCYIYNRYNEASQTKGLMRAIENAQQVNRNLTYIKDEVTEDELKTYAEEQKLPKRIYWNIMSFLSIMMK